MGRTVKVSALILALALLLPGVSSASFLIPQKKLNPNTIAQFVTPLPTFGDGGLGFVLPTRFAADNALGLTRTIEILETQVLSLPDSFYLKLPATITVAPGVTINPQLGTWVYAYREPGQVYNGSWIGPSILAPRGWRDNVVYVNKIANSLLQKYLTTDQTLAWADLNLLACPTLAPIPVGPCALPYMGGDVATAVHFHGTESPSAYDGGPDEWFTNNFNAGFVPAKKGPAYVTNNYVYENQQEPGTFFYHDHGLGITRINVYGGMAGGYVILDNNTNVNGAPLGAATLPSLLNPAVTLPPFPTRWIPLVLQDRMFDQNGQLYFPDIGINPEHPFWVPEFFGDIITVNGKSWPFQNVQADRYRFSIINGSNARFYRLFFPVGKVKKNQPPPVIPPMWVIGTEQGYLDTPVNISATGLVIGPGERYDVVIDFSGIPVGTNFVLTNDAASPYPLGLPVNPKLDGTIMEFRVVGAAPAVPTSTPLTAGTAIRSAPFLNTKLDIPSVTRRLTLNEVLGLGGPLEMLLNNTKYVTQGTGTVTNPITELPKVGATEIWEIINTTVDAHPMHLHLVSFQIIDRQLYDTVGYTALYNSLFPGGVYVPGFGPPFPYNNSINGALGGNPDITPFLLGTSTPPAPEEAGWKDTARMLPGEVTRIMVKFTNQEGGPYSFDATSEPGYVWHCHIVDHEDNEMMRPFKVVAP